MAANDSSDHVRVRPTDGDSTISAVLSDPEKCATLGRYLLARDTKDRCDPQNPAVTDIYRGIRTIVDALVAGVAKQDPRFAGSLIGTGSFFDGLKVGEVDEFDFLLLMDKLSARGDLRYFRSEPGFANLVVKNDYSLKWPTVEYCSKHNKVQEGRSKCGGCPLMDILDALQVQKLFRHVSDKVLSELSLPENWEHGGCHRPRFSGHRRHGPATLYQFVWTSLKREEIKITIDLTLAIKIPTPTDGTPLQLTFRDQYPSSNEEVRVMQNLLDDDPGMAIIPLYSNYMISTGKANLKYTWKISSSAAENRFLERYSRDSLLKTLIRVMKIIRDEYLTYYSRRTKRAKRRRKKRERRRRTSDDGDDEDDDEDAQKPRPKPRSWKTNVNDFDLDGDWEQQLDALFSTDLLSDQRLTEGSEDGNATHIDQNKESGSNEDKTGDSTAGPDQDSSTTNPPRPDHPANPPRPNHPAPDAPSKPQEPATDLTEIEELTVAEYNAKYKEDCRRYQLYDIGLERMTPEPGSGEYWGARQYTASVEIKVLALSFVLTPDKTPEVFKLEPTPSELARHVFLCLKWLKYAYEQRKALASLYFSGPVCTPLNPERRMKVLKILDGIFDDLCKKADV